MSGAIPLKVKSMPEGGTIGGGVKAIAHEILSYLERLVETGETAAVDLKSLPISPDEFKFMIGPEMRLDPVSYEEGKGVRELLAFYMGKNTPDRQQYIIENLRDDVDKQVA